MTDEPLVPVDDLGAHATLEIAEAFEAELAGATTPQERADVLAKYLDPVIGGHWGELPELPA